MRAWLLVLVLWGTAFIGTGLLASIPGTALMLLWKGIGTYLCRNPRYRRLFGPVFALEAARVGTFLAELPYPLPEGAPLFDEAGETLGFVSKLWPAHNGRLEPLSEQRKSGIEQFGNSDYFVITSRGAWRAGVS